MSGYCNDCGNTLCICEVINEQQAAAHTDGPISAGEGGIVEIQGPRHDLIERNNNVSKIELIARSLADEQRARQLESDAMARLVESHHHITEQFAAVTRERDMWRSAAGQHIAGEQATLDQLIAVTHERETLDALATSQVEVIQALNLQVEGLTRERDRLASLHADAIETLKPFADLARLGGDASADETKREVILVRERDLAQAWQVVKVGSRWQPAAAAQGSAGDEGEH